MSAGAIGLTRTALTIAVRYAHTRHTTGLRNGQSVPLFEHGSHRTRLLDALADTYAATLLHRAVLSRWVRGGAADRADNERLVAIAKAWITWQGRAVAVECRERCGAQGLLALQRHRRAPGLLHGRHHRGGRQPRHLGEGGR